MALSDDERRTLAEHRRRAQTAPTPRRAEGLNHNRDNRLMMLNTVVNTFEVLAEPHRREILELLRDGEKMVGFLCKKLDMPQPAVSKHLKVLREADLVEVRVDAQRRWYRLRTEPLMEVDTWLHPYRQLWLEASGRKPTAD